MYEEQKGLSISLLYYLGQYTPREPIREQTIGISIVPKYSPMLVQDVFKNLYPKGFTQDEISKWDRLCIQSDGRAKVLIDSADNPEFYLEEDGARNLAEVLKRVGTSNLYFIGSQNAGVDKDLLPPIKKTLESFIRKYLPRITD